MPEHLTFSGLYAGQPLCGATRAANAPRGTYVHLVYASDAAIAQTACADCRHLATAELDGDPCACPICQRHM